ncbi:hypothetical protein HUN01_07535 [Nostoc edaphicum CCNP1411]|uniref:Uncharacterized protein n=1 Tax=Nostoc edaphicum CCNP1411 TaxID=1472755 RepID=A0A7D7L994_9NOSO|nr:hypothetical protein [Nostoc edaphicum]QMS87436.1 hypothetical protein HUN01_07535 [Nostoc edaphicum CCNP1411]
MTDLINSDSGNSSTGGNNLLINSPFGSLSEVLSDEDLSNIFSGLGNGQGSDSPFGGSGNNGTDFPYGGNPFADDNFWNIFAGGVNPSAGGGRDPLTGTGNQISTTEIPDGFGLRVTINDQINSRLNEELGDNVIPSLAGGSNPFAGGQNPFAGGQNPFAGGSNPFAGGSNPFAGGSNPFAGGSNPFAGGSNPFAGGSNPFAGGQNPFAGGSNPFAGGQNPFAGGSNPFAGGSNPFAGGSNPFA